MDVSHLCDRPMGLFAFSLLLLCNSKPLLPSLEIKIIFFIDFILCTVVDSDDPSIQIERLEPISAVRVRVRVQPGQVASLWKANT